MWMRTFPQSSAQHHFTAKLAQKWKGPYRVIKQVGPLNYQVSLESTGEDVRIVHVCNVNHAFPRLKSWNARRRKDSSKYSMSLLMKRNSLDFKCDSYFHNHGLFSPGRESVAIWKKSIPAFHFF